MNIIYSLEKIPIRPNGLFLAGPTFRDWQPNALKWRFKALELLEDGGFQGDVYIPEYPDGSFNPPSIDAQCNWEHEAMAVAETILFWIPRDLEILPGFTTNVEFGYWMNSNKKVLYGRPHGAPNTRYLDWLYRAEQRGDPFHNLETLIKEVINETQG